MRIIAGKARNLELLVPEGMAVRPTSGRGRKALLDSLGSLDGLRVLDLFAGSGAFALECASRGAGRVTMVESSPLHCECIRENCRRVRRTGVQCEMNLIQGDATSSSWYADAAADLIFADPPYAESGGFFKTLTSSPRFRQAFAGALLVWEIPDAPGARGDFLESGGCDGGTLRNCGGVWFFKGRVKAL